MLSVTKIFRFEAAHAIYGYPGACANIHGHSYELHVSVKTKQVDKQTYIGNTGIVFDFKKLKALVQEAVIKKLDHKLILSEAYLIATPNKFSLEELMIFEAEPSAENLLIYIRNEMVKLLPENIQLSSLKLWETRDSYAEWSAV